MITFRQKDYSNYIADYAIRGAGIGAGLGTLSAATNFTPTSLPSFIPGSSKYESSGGNNNNGSASANQRLLWAAGVTLLGAALGAIIGGIKTWEEKENRAGTNKRLLEPIKRE